MKKKVLFLLMVIVILLSSCAYQRYHARNFQPDKRYNNLKGCRTYSDMGKNSMKYYYRQR